MRNSSLHGLIIIDKPPGLTSHQVVQRVKRILNVSKAGHTGTLDPFATGVLVVCLNEGTKLAPFLQEAQKAYEGMLRLGVETDTQDGTGKILGEEKPVRCSREDIERAFQAFRGRICQTPPMYSALKHEGVPLYRLARTGKEIERPRREVKIYELQILRQEMPRVEFRVVCSKGTYVRTLASDIGAHLECGACLERLRRTKSGDFSLSDSVDLTTLESAPLETVIAQWLITPARAVASLPTVMVNNAVAEKVLHGRIVARSEVRAENLLCGEEGLFKIVNCDGELLAIAETSTRQVKDELPEGEDSAAWKLLRVFRLGVEGR